ncbi:hypothetical protein ACC848_45600, partial [Rhizobium johnstonii]
AGAELDPISATIPVAAECAAAPVAAAEDAPVAAPLAEQPVAEVSEDAPVWPWVVGGGVLALVVAALVWALIARRRA